MDKEEFNKEIDNLANRLREEPARSARADINARKNSTSLSLEDLYYSPNDAIDKLSPIQKDLVIKLINVMLKDESCCQGFSEYDERRDLELKLGLITQEQYDDCYQ